MGMMHVEEPSKDESESASLIKGWLTRERNDGVVLSDLLARDESLFPVTLSIFFSFKLFLLLLWPSVSPTTARDRDRGSVERRDLQSTALESPPL